jgi:hypothetical protein
MSVKGCGYLERRIYGGRCTEKLFVVVALARIAKKLNEICFLVLGLGENE